MDTDESVPVDTNFDAQAKARGKLDVAKAFMLRYKSRLSLSDIGKMFGCTRQAVHKALEPFQELFANPDAIDAYKSDKAGVLEALEFNLALDMVDSARRKAASLNNTAYAFQQVNKALHLERGESTDNVGIHGVVSDLQRRKDELLSRAAEYEQSEQDTIDITPDSPSDTAE